MNKSCPFCGGKELYSSHGTEDREGTPCNISCESCGAQGPWLYLKNSELKEELPKRAVYVWNQRYEDILDL